MGGCRCSYRNCTLRTDGKTHMFHYPVFDKVRCHQWLTNARKLEFLNLKVSQLKNRVVCQHHFKDENFMNFKKDKLTFDAVPTEDGPYCDSSQLDGKNNEGDDTKVFSISLDDIEDEYLTIVDKRANFSVKYGDFLTNCDLMDLDTLNQINDNNQINVNNQIHDNNQVPLQSVCVFDSHVPKEPIPYSRPLRSNTKINNWNSLDNSSNTILKDKTNRKNEIIQDNILIDYNKTPDISNKSEMQQIMQDQNSINLMLNVSHVPIEFDRSKVNNQQMPVEFVESISNTQRQEMPIEFVPPTNSNDQIQQDQSINFKSLEEPKPLNENTNRSQSKGKTKIRIISEKKQILEPVPLIGKLEPVSPNRILTLPSQKKFIYPKPIQSTPEVGNNSIKEISNEVTNKNNVVLEKAKTDPSHLSSNTPASNSRKSNVFTQKTNKIHTFRKSGPNDVTHGTSLLKNKIPPERIAAIAEKRKFNMKLRDIIEDCLDKLDEQDKTDYDKRKPLHNRKMQTKMQQVDSYLAKEPELPEVQDYTIAYLEARMKKMENNLLNKIDENSQKIESLKERCGASSEKKSVHTQTLENEDLHKKQLYQELSKYLSQEANNLIYEELFINKFTQQVPKSPSAKRRKHR